MRKKTKGKKATIQERKRFLIYFNTGGIMLAYGIGIFTGFDYHTALKTKVWLSVISLFVGVVYCIKAYRIFTKIRNRVYGNGKMETIQGKD